MCGIGGVISLAGRPVDDATLQGMSGRMRHRGPDDEGVWRSTDGSVGFVHRRLSIIDTEVRSRQPMISPGGSVVVTYNRELYNYRDLGRELESSGSRFRTTSDTEVIAEALAVWGADALPRFRGMFAIAAHDLRARRTIVVRDPLGIKPAYYASEAGPEQLAFASEIGALRPLVDATTDPEAVVDLLLWGSIAAPRTHVAQIRALPPGHLAEVVDGRLIVRRWADPVDWTGDSDAPTSRDELVDAVRESIRLHLVADVPVAVFLSSGVDSAVVASVAAAADRDIAAVTVTDPQSDESAGASEIARRLGIRHSIVELGDLDVRALVERAVAALDQPSVDGLNSFIVAHAAREAGFKVALSGIGGDELFGGYASARRLRTITRLRQFAPVLRCAGRMLGDAPRVRWARRSVAGKAAWVATYAAGPASAYLVERGLFAPIEVARITGLSHAEVLAIAGSRLEAIGLPSGHENFASAAESALYLRHQLLRDTDAASMASSVEVRTPLVDAGLAAIAARCPASDRQEGPAKRALRSAALHPIDDVVLAPKRGFTLPMGDWIRNGSIELDDGAAALLDADLVRRHLADSRSGTAHWARGWTLHTLGVHTERLRG